MRRSQRGEHEELLSVPLGAFFPTFLSWWGRSRRLTTITKGGSPALRLPHNRENEKGSAWTATKHSNE